MMPVLVVLSVIIAIYSVTRPGALEGVKYFLVPNPANFSWMTVVSAMGQMFYSLSIAMGILVTFGSYMLKDMSIEDSTQNVEIFDTAIAIMAGLMIIPAVFAFSGGDPDTLNAGPALMFITIPKVFANMGLGTGIGILFFLLVLFAAMTSSIALTESAVSTFEDELYWGRKKSTIVMAVIMVSLGSLSCLGQMFYSLSIAMGILVTFGSYMLKDMSIEDSTQNVEIFDTAIAIMAGLMIIPAVFAFSGGDPDTLNAGPALMFITIPKVFANMGLGTGIGILFFLLVLFAAMTSSIALTESAVSTFEDELYWGRKKSTIVMAVIMVSLGSLSCLGYGPLANVTIIGMQFLDFFDFLTNSVMMPIAAIATCLLVSRVIGVKKIEEEVTLEGKPFRRKKIFYFMIQYLCPIFAAIILISSVANAFGWISM